VEIGDTGQPDSAFIRAALTPRDEAPTALIGRPPYEAPYFLQFGRTPLPPGFIYTFLFRPMGDSLIGRAVQHSDLGADELDSGVAHRRPCP
jgi:hypothetical protein